MRVMVLLVTAFVVATPTFATPTQEALCAAAKSGTPSDIEAAIAKGAKANGTCEGAGSSTPLGVANTVANVDNMEALIKAGADPIGTKSYVPLAYVRSVAAAELLLKHGAKVNRADQYGPPLMHLTSSLASNFDDFHKMTEQDVVEIAKLLIDRGANVKYADKYGTTALMNAAFDCLPNFVTLLIDKGADVNAEASTQTPLARLRNIKDTNPVACGATEQVLLSHDAR